VVGAEVWGFTCSLEKANTGILHFVQDDDSTEFVQDSKTNLVQDDSKTVCSG
jgi:hypothetical protein